MEPKHHLIIVGGGAGGLELVTRLGNICGKREEARITLIDKSLTHIWKPLYHELAAGTLATSEDELNYIVHASQHHYRFELGTLTAVDKQHKTITISPIEDSLGQEIIPQRIIHYDTLVLALGSVSQDYNIPGVKEHCFFLDSFEQCQKFHQSFLYSLLQLQEAQLQQLDIAIIGGGATGVELAAELHFACKQALKYKHELPLEKTAIRIVIIESAARVLSGLSKEISNEAMRALQVREIKVMVNQKVVRVNHDNIFLATGESIPAQLKIWAAGIKAADEQRNFGLQTNARNQILVQQTLQTIDDANIFAFGDCASCPQRGEDQPVPPRAQVAQQQADFLVKSLRLRLREKPLPLFFFFDRGSLVSLSRYNTIGGFMGKIIGNLVLEGKLARMAYLFLYRKHQAALFGWWRVALLALAHRLSQSSKARVKLH